MTLSGLSRRTRTSLAAAGAAVVLLTAAAAAHADDEPASPAITSAQPSVTPSQEPTSMPSPAPTPGKTTETTTYTKVTNPNGSVTITRTVTVITVESKTYKPGQAPVANQLSHTGGW